jgi:hypothetical protein
MSPNSKKCRTEKPSLPSFTPLQAALKGLSQDQLIDIIQQLVDKHPDLGEVSIFATVISSCVVKV